MRIYDFLHVVYIGSNTCIVFQGGYPISAGLIYITCHLSYSMGQKDIDTFVL